MNTFLLATLTLFHREVVRFLRQKHRIVGALGTPLVFWFLIGSGLGRSFQNPSLTYLEYFFPGTVVLILLFTAIFSTISIIEDRREGFLQGVLVAPIPRSALVVGKVLGGAALATAQGLLFTLLAPLLGVSMNASQIAYVLAVMFIMSFALTGLGFAMAWRLDSTQGFHAIMNLFLMPLWFLSGALFPSAGAPAWLAALMRANPLSYSVAALHQGFFHVATPGMPAPAVCFVVTLLFAAGMLAAAVAVCARGRTS